MDLRPKALKAFAYTISPPRLAERASAPLSGAALVDDEGLEPPTSGFGGWKAVTPYPFPTPDHLQGPDCATACATVIGRAANRIASGEELLAGLLDAVIDRIADILERVQHDMDGFSSEIFARDKSRDKTGAPMNFEVLLRRIGLAQGLTSRARESLVSIGRLLTFLGRPAEVGHADSGSGQTFSTLSA